MRMRSLVVAAMTASVAACSLTTDLSGLAGTADAGASLDEAGADGPVARADGGDAGATGSDASDGAVPDLCVGAVLCDKFERDAPDGDWSSIYTDHGGTVTIDKTTSSSPTRSLAIFVPPSGDPHGQLSTVGYPNVAHARVAFSMKAGAPNRAISLMRIQLDANDRGAAIDVFMFDGRFVLDENVFGSPSGTYADYILPAGFLPDTWQRWTLELDATGSKAIGVVTLDGVERIRMTLVNSFSRGVLKVLMGAFYATDGPPKTIRFDDVAITILP